MLAPAANDDKPSVLSDRAFKEEVPLHEIVVVGGGAAGLELATGLGNTLARRKRARITLVDKARAHLWKPLLHSVAAGSLDFDEHALDYLAKAHWHQFIYRFGEAIGLDRARKQIQLAATHDEEGVQITPPRSLHYETLVIAIGSITSDFGTPGVSQHAIALETPEQAVQFNHRLVNACIRADAQPDPVRPGQLHVVIVGTGDVSPRAQAAHQEASHLVRQLPRRLRGEPLKPYVYRDFGSLVSLGRSTVGNLMGFLVGENFFIEGYFARLMYRSLYKMHEAALHGLANVSAKRHK